MGRIHRKACIVLALFDAYANCMVKETGLRVTTKQGVRAIAKGNGYYIFLEASECKSLDILIESPLYQTKKLYIDLHKEETSKPKSADEAPNYMFERLNPSRGYPFSWGTTFLKGQIKELCFTDKKVPAAGTAHIHVILQEEMNPVRLLSDYQKGETTIALFGVGEESEGQAFIITDGEKQHIIDNQPVKQQAEKFVLGSSREERRMGYGIEEGLQYSYKRMGSSVLRIHTIETERDGTYFAAFQKIPMEGTRCRISWNTDQGSDMGEAVLLLYGIDNHYQG